MAVIKNIARLLVLALIAAAITAAYFGAVLQESYKITPLTSAEREEQNGTEQGN